MSRELKRVPLDFNWPLHKKWKGYINPRWPECPFCKGSGYSKAAQNLTDEWYGYGETVFSPKAYGATPIEADHPTIIAQAVNNIVHSPDYYLNRSEQQVFATAPKTDPQSLVDFVADNPVFARAINREAHRFWRDCVAGQWGHHLIQADVDALVQEDRLWDFTRRPINPEQEALLREQRSYWLKEPNGYSPTPEEVNLWSLGGIGHDALNRGVCVKARCLREGVPHLCDVCQGHGTQQSGITKKMLKNILVDTTLWAEDLPNVIPPETILKLQDAWEETDPPVGEGYQLWQSNAPNSPVFSSLEDLCAWAEENHVSTFGDNRATKEQWLAMLTTGCIHHTEILANGKEVTFIG